MIAMTAMNGNTGMARGMTGTVDARPGGMRHGMVPGAGVVPGGDAGESASLGIRRHLPGIPRLLNRRLIDCTAMHMQITSRLTLVVIVVWVVSLVVRVVDPTLSQVFIGSDATVLVVIGYYFSAGSIAKRRNGKGGASV